MKKMYEHAQWGEQTMRLMRAMHNASRVMRHKYHKKKADEGTPRLQRLYSGFLIRGLRHEGALPEQELARHLGLSEDTVSGIIDSLEAKGYVEREHPINGMSSGYVRLSKNYIQERHARHEAIDKRIDEFVKSLSEEEIGTASDVLERFTTFFYEGGIKEHRCI